MQQIQADANTMSFNLVEVNSLAPLCVFAIQASLEPPPRNSCK